MGVIAGDDEIANPALDGLCYGAARADNGLHVGVLRCKQIYSIRELCNMMLIIVQVFQAINDDHKIVVPSVLIETSLNASPK